MCASKANGEHDAFAEALRDNGVLPTEEGIRAAEREQ
jgi:hypothetical protein